MNGLPEPYLNGTHVVVHGRTVVVTEHAPNSDGWRYRGTPSDLTGDTVHFSHEEARPVIRAVRTVLASAGLDPDVYDQEIAAIQAENVEPELTPLDALLDVVEHIARRGHAELRQALNIYRETAQ